MSNISKYFNRDEFACKDNCGFMAVDKELLYVLEKVRKKFGPVNITSGCRCLEYNRKIGSSDTSQHIRGMAADFWIKDIKPEKIINWINKNLLLNNGGLGIYDDFCHIDVRKKLSRWDNRSCNYGR